MTPPCYAETFAERWLGIPGHPFEQGFDVRLWPERLGVPLRRRKSTRYFVNSMSDFSVGVKCSVSRSLQFRRESFALPCPRHVSQTQSCGPLLDQLVLTERYKLLLSTVGTLANTRTPAQRVLNGMLALELEDRVVAFDTAVKDLGRQIGRWSGLGHYVVPDTSFYIKHPAKLEDIGLVPLIGHEYSDFVVLVPMIVVDELDRLKESKDKQVRWRASYTLAVLDRLFTDGVVRTRLIKGGVEPGPDGLTPPEVGIEPLFDPPGHVRLPDSDEEIIDRALSVEPLAARRVTLLTYDTGQSMRARHAGLQAVRLSLELDDAP